MNTDREKYCPNMILDTPKVSIGEFKTLTECMSFPIAERWCINRKDGNKFDKYKSQGNRILIICCWDRHDAWRFVIAIVKNGIKYFDLNDLPMDLVSNDFEKYLGTDIVNNIHSINNQTNIRQSNNIKTEENMIRKNRIRLTESQFHRLISESLKKVLNEMDKREFFTLDITNISTDESIDDMEYSHPYYSFDEAVEAAKQCAYQYKNYKDVVNVFVMAGENELETGDVYGEPEAVYCISNKGQKETQIAREQAGYSTPDCDEYLNESICRSKRKHLR